MISFCQQSLAEVAPDCRASRPRGFARHRMGLQHANFPANSWKDGTGTRRSTLEEETGLAPASRPGNGFYDDHAPRGMLLRDTTWPARSVV
ncbi:MAG: hypothetical protein ACLTTP_07985 [Alistipes ihumii]